MDYLYCNCPIDHGCDKNKKIYWYHKGCGSKTIIRYEDIHVYCSGCSTNMIIFDWKFQCGDHKAQYASKQGLLYALTIMAQSTGK